MKGLLTFISRGNCRGGYQWSTTSTKRGLNNLGFQTQSLYPGMSVIQSVQLEGTRDQIIKDRRTITKYLRMVGGKHIGIRFEVL